MGNEIARLKNENRRTKTSIQRMKTFHKARKLRRKRDKSQGTELANRENLSDNRSRSDSGRKTYYKRAGDQGQHFDLGAEHSSNDSGCSLQEFKNKRRMIRASRQVNRQGLSTRERVATANIISRRANNPGGKHNASAKDKIEVPKMRHVDSKMDLIYERLKQC